MTIEELMIVLSKYDPDQRVVTRGYEGGYCDPLDPFPVEINLNVNNDPWCGPHDDAYDGEKGEITAVVIV